MHLLKRPQIRQEVVAVGIARRRLDLLDKRSRLVRVSRCNDDGDALLREFKGRDLADALGGAGDKADRAFHRAGAAPRLEDALATADALPTPNAASAPITASPATIVKDGRKPAMNAVGLARLPKAAKTEVATATPKAPPKRWRVLLTPDALPISARSTALNAAVGATGNTMATPIPVNAIGIASRQYSTLALATDANHT